MENIGYYCMVVVNVITIEILGSMLKDEDMSLAPHFPYESWDMLCEKFLSLTLSVFIHLHRIFHLRKMGRVRRGRCYCHRILSHGFKGNGRKLVVGETLTTKVKMKGLFDLLSVVVELYY